MNLQRFIEAQNNVFENVIDELVMGEKQTHWMWYIFPQIAGLGNSATAKYYAIESIEEAQAYLNDPTLSSRLIKCCQILLTIEGKRASDIFGYTDAKKLLSSMTLFDYVQKENNIFREVLDKYFEGFNDPKTIQILNDLKN